jgi:hypothetical protein
MSEFIPPQRIASKLREAPFYIREDNMDFYVMVEQIFNCLRELRMITMARKFETFTIEDYEVKLGCHYAIQNVVRLTETYEPPLGGIVHPNQVVFTVPDETLDTSISTELTQVEQIKKITPHLIGEYIDYTMKSPECLQFKETDILVGIEYNGIAVDEEGYPLITDRAQEACVYFVAYMYFLGEFMANRIDGQRIGYFEGLKERKMREARSDHRLSQNQMDKLLNTMTSFDRKAWGWSA